MASSTCDSETGRRKKTRKLHPGPQVINPLRLPLHSPKSQEIKKKKKKKQTVTPKISSDP